MALTAAVLLVLRFVPGLGGLFGDHALGRTLRVLTTLTVAITVIYCVSKGIVWSWRRLMWRVRRRLAVTYLFIGLTPIVLLGVLGLISAFGLSAEAMARLVGVLLETITTQARADQGEEYGEARLLDFALRNRDCSAEALRRAVFEEIDRWSAGQDREDDQTRVIIRALQLPGSVPLLPA